MALTDQRHSGFRHAVSARAGREGWPGRACATCGPRGWCFASAAIGAVRLAPGTHDRLHDAEEFLMRIRSGLHLDTGRNANVLSYELQEKAAERLRYSGPDVRRRVEALMTDYFRDARSVTRALGRVRRAALPPPPTPIRLIGENLMWVVEGITFADAASRRRLAGRVAARVRSRRLAQRACRRRCARVDRAGAAVAPSSRRTCFIRRRSIDGGSCSFCARGPGLAARLSEMRDCGLLGAIFPELNEISCRVTRDFYHKYTVDEHTLLTVRNVERLLSNPPVRSRAARAARARAARAGASVSRRRESPRRRPLDRRRRDGRRHGGAAGAGRRKRARRSIF